MAKVLVVSPNDLRLDLARTVLGRSHVEFVLARNARKALKALRTHRPRLVIIALGERDATERLVRRIRKHKPITKVSLVVSLASLLPAEERSLRRAGATVLLPGRVDPFLWNEPLEKLLRAATRREVGIPVRFWVWYRFSPDENPVRGQALNVSVAGMLVEADQPLEVEPGTQVETEFTLPGREQPLNAMARVVRKAGASARRRRFGIKFLSLPSRVRGWIEDFVEAGN